MIFSKRKVRGGHPCPPLLHHGHIDDAGTDKLILELVERDVKDDDERRDFGQPSFHASSNAQASAYSAKDDGRLRKMEAEHQAHIWMNYVLNYVKPDKQKTDYEVIVNIGDTQPSITKQGENYDEGEEEEEVTPSPSESPTNLGPSGPRGGGGGGGDPHGSPSHSSGRRGGDPPGPPSEDPTDVGDHDVTEVKIPRREADKVVVPPFPKVTHLDSWMSHRIANLLSACADPNHEEWISWIQPAFRPNPDIEGMNDSGHLKLKSIDVKLGLAMTAMLKSAGDVAADLYLDVNRIANRYARNDAKLIKGRQIIAMMYESFRTRDRLDMIFALEYPIIYCNIKEIRI